MQSVAARLRPPGVPVVPLRPTEQPIRAGLQIATLLAGYRMLEDAQLAVAGRRCPTLRDSARRPAPRQSARNCGSPCTGSWSRRRSGSRPRSARPATTASWSSPPAAPSPGPPTASGVPPVRGAGPQRPGDRHRGGRRHGPDGAGGRGARPRRRWAGPGLDRPSPATARGHRRPGRRSRPAPAGARPERPGPGAWRPSPGWPRSCPRPTPRSSSTPRRPGSCWPSRRARRGGCCTSLVEEGLAWPLPPSRTPQPGRPARPTGWSSRSWSAAGAMSRASAPRGDRAAQAVAPRRVAADHVARRTGPSPRAAARTAAASGRRRPARRRGSGR